MQTQRKHQANTQHHGVLSAWHAQIADAAQSPALKQQLINRERELLPNFASHYTKLSALPRRTRRTLQREWKRSLAGGALLLALGQTPALAAVINVGGACTLAEAIASANANAPLGGCTAGAGADIVVLPAPPTPLPALTTVNNTTFGATGLPVIAAASAVTIQGNGATIRRAITAPEFRIFAVATGGTLTLQQTTITGGKLTVGTTPYGGGVYNYGTLRLINGTIDGNSATYGGGVYNNGTFTMTGSTISGNSATSDSGGGVYNNDAATTFTMINSTISGNSAGTAGGGVYNETTFTMTNSTISGNSASVGGGVYNETGGTLTLDSTLISGNTAPSGREIYSQAAITTNNFNLFGFNNNSGLVKVTPGVTDIVPDAGILPSEILDPLADNPGANPLIAVTQTHALVAGSPALDAVGEGCPPPAVDQRGIARAAGTCDIGSFELAAAPPPPTTPPPTTPPPVDGTCFGLIATITGTEIDESIRGTKGPDVINALGGDDTVTGGSGNDRLCGGAGNDTLSGGKGADRLDGGEETDECNGGTGPGKVLGPDTGVNCEALIAVP